MLNVQAIRNKFAAFNDLLYFTYSRKARHLFTQYGRHAVQRNKGCAHTVRAHQQLNARLIMAKNWRHWGRVGLAVDPSEVKSGTFIGEKENNPAKSDIYLTSTHVHPRFPMLCCAPQLSSHLNSAYLSCTDYRVLNMILIH